MKHKEFVAWLEGYLNGCSISDAQIEKIMTKAKEVEPDRVFQWRGYPYIPASWPASYTFRVDCGGITDGVTMPTDGTITYDNKAPHTLT